MKVSIWQQFSSNHSAAFELVGTFESADVAEQVAAECREILQQVREWYDQNYTNDEQVALLEKDTFLSLSTVEENIRDAKQLKQWKYSVDWAMGLRKGAENQVVRVFGNLLFMQSSGESWVGSQPFEELIERQAKDFVVDVEGIDDEPNYLRVTCTVATNDSAKIIMKQLYDEEFLSDGTSRPLIKLPQRAYYEGNIELADNKITFEMLPLFTFSLSTSDTYHIADFLQDLTTYLRANDCQDIQIEAYQEEW